MRSEPVELAPDGTAAEASTHLTRDPFAAAAPAWTAVTRAAAKRALDVVLSATILVVMIPVALLVVLAIVIETGGPVLYRAERMGRGRRSFRMLKFRKMYAHAGGLRLTTSDDIRFTRVGAFLARTKLDELPQFVNVLRGDMSLIGPRPEDPGFVDRRQDDYDAILQVRPGITGLAQLAFADESRILSREDPLGHYLDAIFPQKCALDRLYVRSVSVSTDLRILFWTVVAILFKRPVAVHRATGRMSLRKRRAGDSLPATA